MVYEHLEFYADLHCAWLMYPIYAAFIFAYSAMHAHISFNIKPNHHQ